MRIAVKYIPLKNDMPVRFDYMSFLCNNDAVVIMIDNNDTWQKQRKESDGCYYDLNGNPVSTIFHWRY